MQAALNRDYRQVLTAPREVYRALSADGRPELSTIFKVMQALGLRLAPVRMKPAA